MTSLRAALVGYGSAGRGIHGPLLQAAGYAVPLVVTRDTQRAAAARAQLGAEAVGSLDDVLRRRDEVDVVVVASSTAAHVGNALAAVEARLPVVVDKPLGLTAAQAAPLVKRARELDVPLTVFQNRRWDSEHRTLCRLLRDGALGQVVRYEARFERWRPVPKDRWRERLPASEGGGLLLDLHSHLVDGAIDLFGPVVSVYAEIAGHTTVADDDTFLALTHANGVRSHLSATSVAGAPGPRTRVLGTAGAYLVAAIEGEGTPYAEWRDEPESRGWLVRGEERAAVRREPGEWGDFYPAVARALTGGGPLPVDVQDALAVLTVLDAAQASAARSEVVPLS